MRIMQRNRLSAFVNLPRQFARHASLLVMAVCSLSTCYHEVGAEEGRPKNKSGTGNEKGCKHRRVFAILTANTYGDGGSVSVELAGPCGKQLFVSLSQDLWPDDPVPHATLFLDAAYYMDYAARLPRSQAEAKYVIETLQNALQLELPIFNSSRVSDKEFASVTGAKDRIALAILLSLKQKKTVAVYDEMRGVKPLWYDDYIEDRKSYHARIEAAALNKP